MKQLSLRLIVCGTILAPMMTACSSPFSTSQPPTPTPISSSQGPTPTPMPSGMVDIGGRKLFFECTGQGSPTVVLEAGEGVGATGVNHTIRGGVGNSHPCQFGRDLCFT